MILISFLFMAWILTLFEFDDVFVHGIDEIFNKEVTANTYWFVFLGVGFVLQTIHALSNIW